MPMIRRRWYRPWIPCPRCWAHRQRGPWIPATSARPTSPLWNSAALNHTSRWDAKRITTIGRSIALHRLRLHRMTRAHWSKWPPNSERRSARPSIACANAPSNPCLASSKKCWAFANSPYAAGRPPPESGVWSVWPSISNDCMCCAPTERRVSLLEARKTSDGTSPADPNVQPLSERAAHSCPMSRSDPCRIFLSDRLLGAFAISPRPGVPSFPGLRLLCPIRLPAGPWSLRWGLPYLLSTLLDIPSRLSRVRYGGLKRNAVGGVLLTAPSALCGFLVVTRGRSGLPVLSVAMHAKCIATIHTTTDRLWVLVPRADSSSKVCQGWHSP